MNLKNEAHRRHPLLNMYRVQQFLRPHVVYSSSATEPSTKPGKDVRVHDLNRKKEATNSSSSCRRMKIGGKGLMGRAQIQNSDESELDISALGAGSTQTASRRWRQNMRKTERASQDFDFPHASTFFTHEVRSAGVDAVRYPAEEAPNELTVRTCLGLWRQGSLHSSTRSPQNLGLQPRPICSRGASP